MASIESPSRTSLSAIAALILLSLAASALICYLVYFRVPVDVAGTKLRFLPAFNASLNLCCTIALVAGFICVRRRRIVWHRRAMLTAFVISTVFLVSYLTNIALHGEGHFDRLSPWWPFYWKLLASHIVLSVFALPMILITFFFALTGRFPAHKKIARYTFPVWLYVSVTGVIVYFMQAEIH